MNSESLKKLYVRRKFEKSHKNWFVQASSQCLRKTVGEWSAHYISKIRERCIFPRQTLNIIYSRNKQESQVRDYIFAFENYSSLGALRFAIFFSEERFYI